MFGSATYLEDNTFATGHQNVNVYGLPEKTYEVRTEDTAVDIQIHRNHKENDGEEVSSDTEQEDETVSDDKMVISPTYGTGRIVDSREIDSVTIIDVEFDSGERRSFSKELAFKNGTIRQRKN